MQRLITIITSAIAVIMGYKAVIASQQAHIDELQKQIDDDTTDDAALEARAKAAEDRAAAIESDLTAANAKADELANAITVEPTVPSVDPDFNVTAPPTAAPDSTAGVVTPGMPNIPGVDLAPDHQRQPAPEPVQPAPTPEQPTPEPTPAPGEPAPASEPTNPAPAEPAPTEPAPTGEQPASPPANPV